jgi:hypothetical protein
VHQSPYQTRLSGSIRVGRDHAVAGAPESVPAEIDLRYGAARNADPFRRRKEELRREQVRIEKNSDRLVTAYQEDW